MKETIALAEVVDSRSEKGNEQDKPGMFFELEGKEKNRNHVKGFRS